MITESPNTSSTFSNLNWNKAISKVFIVTGMFLVVQIVAGLLALTVQATIQVSTGQAVVPDHIEALPLLLSLLASSVLTIIFTLLICKGKIREVFALSLPKQSSVRILGLSILTMIPIFLLSNEFTAMIGVPDTMKEEFEMLTEIPWAIVVLALAGPIAEEVCFRYGIAGQLLRVPSCKTWIAVVVSALLFGIIHFNPAQIVNAFIIGLYLGWLYAKTRSLWPCLICHILNNIVSVVIITLSCNEFELKDLTPGRDSALYITIIVGLFIISGLLLYVFNKQLNKQKSLN